MLVVGGGAPVTNDPIRTEGEVNQAWPFGGRRDANIWLCLRTPLQVKPFDTPFPKGGFRVKVMEVMYQL